MSESLTQRRAALISRSRAERAALIAAAEPLLRNAAVADRLFSRIRRHPVATAVIGAAVVLVGSRKLFDIVTRTLTIYALFRRR